MVRDLTLLMTLTLTLTLTLPAPRRGPVLPSLHDSDGCGRVGRFDPVEPAQECRWHGVG